MKGKGKRQNAKGKRQKANVRVNYIKILPVYSINGFISHFRRVSYVLSYVLKSVQLIVSSDDILIASISMSGYFIKHLELLSKNTANVKGEENYVL